MGSVSWVSQKVNYVMTTTDHTIKKVAANPSAVKKVLQLANKIFAAYDLYHFGEIKSRDVNQVMKGTIEIIEFYGSYKNIMYWVHLFSKETLDEKTLKQSIESSLCASHKKPQDIRDQQKIAAAVFTDVMNKKAYHSKGEVYAVIRASLEKQGYTADKAQLLAERVIVQQKARPITQQLYMACFTIADIGGNIMTLKKWHILDLAPLAASIGSQSRVFLFVVNLGADTVLGTIASAGLVLVVGEATYRTIKYSYAIYISVDDKEKADAYKELRNALLDLLAGGTDLVYTAAPMLIALNPPVIIGLAIIAKGTGLICILVR